MHYCNLHCVVVIVCGIAAPDVVVCFLAALAHKYTGVLIATSNVAVRGGDGCVCLFGGIVAGCCGWIVVSRCTCRCCSAPA